MSSTTVIPNAIDYVQIKNTISNYCIALDSKDFSLLQNVFTNDVQAKYPFSDFTSSTDLQNAIEKRLSPVDTQHAITTQSFTVSEDGQTVSATSYFTGIHFGRGKWKGQQVTAWGRYVDKLVCKPDLAALPGATGNWLISHREVIFMGRLGEEGVMTGE